MMKEFTFIFWLPIVGCLLVGFARVVLGFQS
jgi:hypothetical protein